MLSLLEQEEKKTRKKYFFFAGILLVTVLRFLFFSERGLNQTNSPHDDLLFLQQAYSLIHGDYLGSYNHLTLTKAPGFSFFCAARNAFR